MIIGCFIIYGTYFYPQTLKIITQILSISLVSEVIYGQIHPGPTCSLVSTMPTQHHHQQCPVAVFHWSSLPESSSKQSEMCPNDIVHHSQLVSPQSQWSMNKMLITNLQPTAKRGLWTLDLHGIRLHDWYQFIL